MEQKVLFWDFDGTLGYRIGGMWSSACHEALLAHQPHAKETIDDFLPLLRAGFPWHQPDVAHTEIMKPEAWWTQLRTNVLERAYRTLGYSQGQAEQFAWTAQGQYVKLSRWTLYEDVLPVLSLLKDQGWTHAILSNHVPELQQIVTHLGLADLVAVVISSALVGYEKPHPHLFKIALERLGHPSRVWMIGDQLQADVRGAERVGINGILVRKEEARADNRAVRFCRTLYEIPLILQSG